MSPMLMVGGRLVFGSYSEKGRSRMDRGREGLRRRNERFTMVEIGVRLDMSWVKHGHVWWRIVDDQAMWDDFLAAGTEVKPAVPSELS